MTRIFTTYSAALALVCLVYPGHGRRVQISAPQWKSSDCQDASKKGKVLNDTYNFESFMHIARSSEQAEIKRNCILLTILLRFLLAFNPAAQYSNPGEVQHSMPWWEGLPSVEVVSSLVHAYTHCRSLSRFPALTSGLILLNSLAHLFQERAFSVYQYGLQPSWVWQKRGLSWQLVISSFLHLNLEQLIINMCSLIVHGTNFEELMRPNAYAKLVSYAAIAPNVMMVLGTRLCARWSCAYKDIYTDFSGALSCLATVWRCQVLAPMGQKLVVYGIPVQSQYAWLELVIQKLLNPGISVMRQVSGLMAGVIYVYVPRLHRCLVREWKKLNLANKRLLQIGAVVLFTFGLVLSVQLAGSLEPYRSNDLQEFRDALKIRR